MDSTQEVGRRRASQDITSLYQKHAGGLKRYVRRRVDSDEEAEDIVQNLFLGVCQGDAISEANANSEAFLLGIARHLVAKHLRKKQSDRRARRVRSATESQFAPEACPSDGDVEKIRTLLERLPPTAREALRLRFVRGLTAKEAAARLGCSKHAFQQRLHAAVKAFRTLALERLRTP